jgi:protein-S-isoprenylcysteine O-methyltransferase Ste14
MRYPKPETLNARLVLNERITVPLVGRIRAEERLLREHFGAKYDAYCKRTWRLVPRVY